MRAKNLKELRTKKGLSQKDFSMLCGKTISTISSAENGKNMSEETMAAFAKALKVSILDLAK